MQSMAVAPFVLCINMQRDWSHWRLPLLRSNLSLEVRRWKAAMEKLPEVETAKALMNEAMRWSVMKWLREKKKVRKTADQANAALDKLSASVKRDWPDSVRTAYAALLPEPASGNGGDRKPTKPLAAKNGEASAVAGKVKQADDEAYRARMLAEDTFDEAERVLSTSLAREGCVKAIQSWELHEKAIRQAEELRKRPAQ